MKRLKISMIILLFVFVVLSQVNFEDKTVADVIQHDPNENIHKKLDLKIAKILDDKSTTYVFMLKNISKEEVNIYPFRVNNNSVLLNFPDGIKTIRCGVSKKSKDGGNVIVVKPDEVKIWEFDIDYRLSNMVKPKGLYTIEWIIDAYSTHENIGYTKCYTYKQGE